MTMKRKLQLQARDGGPSPGTRERRGRFYLVGEGKAEAEGARTCGSFIPDSWPPGRKRKHFCCFPIRFGQLCQGPYRPQTLKPSPPHLYPRPMGAGRLENPAGGGGHLGWGCCCHDILMAPLGVGGEAQGSAGHIERAGTRRRTRDVLSPDRAPHFGWDPGRVEAGERGRSQILSSHGL